MEAAKDQKWFADMVARLHNDPKERKRHGVDRCLLCAKKADAFAAFLPTPEMSKLLGAPQEKMRVVFYGMCTKCAYAPGCSERVEQRIVETFAPPPKRSVM
jgi:hypothetical protein